jgi:hypothetical protein
MTGPRRWTDETGGASSLERRLLRSAKRVAPRSGARERVLARVLGAVGAAGAAGAAAGAASAATSAGATSVTGGGAASGAAAGVGAAAGKAAVSAFGAAAAAKWVAIGVAGAVAVLGARQVATTTSVPPEQSAITVAQRSPSAPARTVQNSLPAASVVSSASAEPDRSASSVPNGPPVAVVDRGNEIVISADAAAPSMPDLSASAIPAPAAQPVVNDRAQQWTEESAALGDARQRLQRGDAAGALAILDGAQRRFPSGALSQEREALSIEALARTGQRQAARQRAEAFLRVWPSSPYADVVRVHVQ